MVELNEYFGNFPFKPGEKKPIALRRDNVKMFIYPPYNPNMSDLNWLYASTDNITVAIYQLAPGSWFEPTDIHPGDEPYYILSGTLTLLNPENGQVVEVNQGEAVLIPKGVPHQGYNFTDKETRILVAIAPKIWESEGAPLSYQGKFKLYKYTK